MGLFTPANRLGSRNELRTAWVIYAITVPLALLALLALMMATSPALGGSADNWWLVAVVAAYLIGAPIILLLLGRKLNSAGSETDGDLRA